MCPPDKHEAWRVDDVRRRSEDAAVERTAVCDQAQDDTARHWFGHYKGDWPLHAAMRCGRLDVVKWLLKEDKAAVGDADGAGQTPIFLAAEGGRLEVLKYLVEDQGARIDVHDNGGQTPLHN
eukprot:Selendium_serpulae@DN11433_c0_g1_i1.p2